MDFIQIYSAIKVFFFFLLLLSIFYISLNKWVCSLKVCERRAESGNVEPQGL